MVDDGGRLGIIKQAAQQETVGEAGVLGTIERQLGNWCFRSNSQDAIYERYMFPLLVSEQLDTWPEKNLRQRVWMTPEEAREVCQYWWMKEALDILVSRLTCEKHNNQE
ncbi:nudix hydrolase 18, mitochondrial-like [Punica granatum]|uniref:Nudix hydrolase 18, mitochondrial-like n=1 Tax=Punica granatum TaxID=22663 RepID=A0A6P8DWP0_PUNGR|nr:nudix hydrolase 18, mitochondrial-like [Punica granatum]